MATNALGSIDRSPFVPHLTYMVSLPEQARLDDLASMPRGLDRKRAVFNRLIETANRTQGPILDVLTGLAQLGAVGRVERMFSPNMLVVSATGVDRVDEILDTLHDHGITRVSRASDGSKVEFSDRKPRPTGDDVPLPPSDVDPEHSIGHDVDRLLAPPSSDAPGTDSWQLGALGAHAAWAQGATGAGLVFGSIDTGVDASHPALAASYRGAATGQHDHNWFDFGTTPSDAPRDYRWHGTHTTGSVVGNGPKGPFGVAPGAAWIAVAGMTPQRHDVLNLMRAVQWMQAPTDRTGANPDPTAAPDVVGMSWWAAPSAQDLFRDSIRNLVGAGIVPVKSMGNQGPGPETGTSPGQFPEVLTVGAIDVHDQVPPFSSRGPSAWHEPGSPPPDKPDYVAPGVKIRSAVPGNQYATWSGTSMAQPQVSGAILAILSAYPTLSDSDLLGVLRAGARDLGPIGWDRDTGLGAIDLRASLDAAKALVESRHRDADAIASSTINAA